MYLAGENYTNKALKAQKVVGIYSENCKESSELLNRVQVGGLWEFRVWKVSWGHVEGVLEIPVKSQFSLVKRWELVKD